MIQLIKNTFRNLQKNPILIFVNIPGLIIGLAVFLLLMLYVKHETNFDKQFTTKNRVVRLYNSMTDNNSVDILPLCNRDAYTEIPKQIPEIESAVQIYRGWNTKIKFQDKKIYNQNFIYADNEFFKVFGLSLIDGNSGNALKDRSSVVLSQTLAKTLFGNKTCLGKVIVLDNEKYTITGVIKDFPKTSHIQFDFLVSMSTIYPEKINSLEFFTYYLLRKNTDQLSVSDKIAKLNTKLLNERFKKYELKFKIASGVEKLTSLHLHTIADFDLTKKGNITNIYIVGLLAMFILLIAIVNHVNLFVLHGEKRFVEIGIRKALGASRKSLGLMFYVETFIIITISFTIAILLASALLPYFSYLLDINLEVSEMFQLNWIIGIIVFIFSLTLVSAIYPAYYLSKQNTINSIKGDVKSTNRKKWLSTGSVLLQFSISVLLISSLLIIYSQVTYLKRIPLGFSSDKVLVVDNFEQEISKNATPVLDELKKLPFVTSVASSLHTMGGGCSGQLIKRFGEQEDTWKSINEYRVQKGFCKLLNLNLISGRFFRNQNEDKRSIILNQAAVRMLNLSNPIGKQLIMFNYPMRVIGVVKDFYYNNSSGEIIKPLVISDYNNYVNSIYVKISGDLSKFKRAKIINVIKQFDENSEPEIRELNNIYTKKFSKEDRLINILFYGTLLAVLLSFIGMFALSVFNVERHTKEIGVRKVLGSTSMEILILLFKGMLKWVLFSIIPASIIAYLIMQNYLNNFANKININIMYFIISGAGVLIIAILAIAIKSIKAATQNPVKSIRYE